MARRAPTGGREQAALAAPQFVGREREIMLLTEIVSGPPTVALIEGEAGIGKSRLLHQVLSARPAGARRALVASCPPVTAGYTLGPVVDAVRQATDCIRGLRLSGLAGALRPLFPEWAADLPPLPEPPEDATAARHRLFRALAELLGCLDVAILAVEDVHWADEATLELLLFLAAQKRPPVCLVLSNRPEDLPADSLLLRLTSRPPSGTGLRRVALGPLSVTETATLMSSMLGGEHVSAEFAQLVHQYTEGVPLAVEESIRLMHDRADLAHRNGAWVRRPLSHIAVPPTVRDAVLERVARLDPKAQALLRAAAVVSDPTDEATLATVSGLAAGETRAGLIEALDAGLLHENASRLLSFRHALAGQTMREAIPLPDRQALHLRAGRVLAAMEPPPVARIARHFREAGDNASWCRYAEQAADLALAAGDEAAAGALFHDLVVGGGGAGAAAMRLAERVSFTAFPHTRFRSLVQGLRSLLDTPSLDPGEQAEIRFQLGRVLIVMAEYEAGRTELERAIPRLPLDSAEAARAMIFLGLPLGNVQPASVHLTWLRRAAAALERLEPDVQARLLVDMATALLLLGEEAGWAEAARIRGHGATPNASRSLVVGHLNVGHLAMLWGHYAEANRRLALAREIAERRQYVRSREIILATAVHLDWFVGAWDGLAERAAALADDEEAAQVTRGEAALVAGLLEAAAGNLGEAERRLRFTRDEAERRQDVDRLIESAAAQARVWLRTGRVGDALRITEEPAETAVRKGIWTLATEVVPVRTEALLGAARIDEAQDLVGAFGRVLGDHDAAAPRATLRLCEALLAESRGEQSRAAQRYDRASAAWQALPRPYDALLAKERHAGCLLAAGRDVEAVQVLTDVLDGLHRLGARGDASRVMHRLRAQGVHVAVPWRGGQRGYGDKLSPRELDVARLLVGGRTNREIGKALFLSPKTVARHLDSAMRKLGVPSRTALAVKVVETGIVPGQEHVNPARPR